MLQKLKDYYEKFIQDFKILFTIRQGKYYPLFIILSLLLIILNISMPNFQPQDSFLSVFLLLLWGILSLTFSYYFIKLQSNFARVLAIIFISLSLLVMTAVQTFIITFFRITNLYILSFILLIYSIIVIIFLIEIYKSLGYSAFDKIYIIIFGLISYFAIVFDTSLIIFFYYFVRKYIQIQYYYDFINSSNLIEGSKVLLNTSMANLFNYPNIYSNTPLSYKLPYFFTKVLDTFLMAYIFLRATANEPEKVLHNKIQKLEDVHKTLLNKNKNLTKENKNLIRENKALILDYENIICNLQKQLLNSKKNDTRNKYKTEK